MSCPKYFACAFLGWLVFASGILTSAASESWVHAAAQPGDFPLVQAGRAVPVRYSTEDYRVVEIAAGDFVADVERVTRVRPDLVSQAETVVAQGIPTSHAVWIGTLGHSPLIDGLVAAGKLDATALRGQWETFLITTVEAPQPGVAQALVIAGSDRRGTAFGVYELSQAIGVSPWYWWADVVPQRKEELFVAAGTRKFGPPSVQYRGIFINDEDWGLQPWAARNFAPEEGGIGPKVYRRVFELLLRLKANTLWPAMHKCSKAFNLVPENARLADDYAIVMGSSHAEPMLRNNVGEWNMPAEQYNYVNNRTGVLKYWEERMATNGRFENIYTLGMRGIHDSGMIGPKTDPERIATLEQVFKDQRALIAKYVKPGVEPVPQIFCAYKEVLDLYRKGLKVPDDVTIVWPDDNFGYVRDFASPEECKRRGGFGVYYHVSYLGKPLSYLWLCTTPPALIWEEMNKAYDHGARKFWVLNVGDIKPAEIDTEFFLQMAWDIRRWQRENLPGFLTEWATREFGSAFAKDIADEMSAYYQFNYQRKPEHLQWWLAGQEKRWCVADLDEDTSWLTEWPIAHEENNQKWQKLAAMPKSLAPAFGELVAYPIQVSMLLRRRYAASQNANLAVVAGKTDRARQELKDAKEADALLHHLMADLNGAKDMPLSKWRGIWTEEPADDQWKSMRMAKWEAPVVPALSAEQKRPRSICIDQVPVEEGKETSLPLNELFSPTCPFINEEGQFKWEMLSHDDWIGVGPVVSPASEGGGRGHVITIDWNKAPRGNQVAGALVLASGNKRWTLHVPIFNPEHPRPEEIKDWFVEVHGAIAIEAEHFNAKVDSAGGAGWAVIPGLGRTGDGSVAVFPTTQPAVPLERAKTDAPRLDYNLHFFTTGQFTLRASLIPMHPISGRMLQFAVALDDAAPLLMSLEIKDGSPEWAQGVLDNTRVVTSVVSVPTPGAHVLHVYGLEPGVVIDKMVFFQGAAPRGYLGPQETQVHVK